VPFSFLYGNKKAFKQLALFIGRTELPNSIILRGPEGVGKFTACLELVRRVNCTGDREHACRCESCLKLLRGISPNRLAFSGKITHAELRELQAKLGMRVGVGHRFVVLRAENLERSAQDMFLKTIEEPAEKTTFLITSSRANLNRTVISRSFSINFTSCTSEELADFVMGDKMALKLFSGFAKEDATMLLVLAAGSPGVLVRLLSDPTVKVKLAQVRAFFSGIVKPEFFRQIEGLGEEDLAWMVRSMAMARLQGLDVVKVSESWAKVLVDRLVPKKFYPVKWRIMSLYMEAH